MSYQGKTLEDVATIAEEKLCPFSNELLIDFIGVSLKLATSTELLSKTIRELKKLILKHCEEGIFYNEELEEPAKREKLLNTLNLTVCSYHVTYAFQSESTLYSCLNVKELLARSRREI